MSRDPAPCAHLDFIVIGAMKAGTTSLFDFLGGHPGVHVPRNKEPHYFTHGYGSSVDHYRRLFRDRRPGQLTGEASPTYSWIRRFPECPARIARDAPQARLVYLVRDPVERAVSQYRHDALLGQVDRALDDPDLWDRGRYRETIEAYLEEFDRHRLLVADLADLQRDPRWLATILSFLGLWPSGVALELPRSGATEAKGAVPAWVGRLARSRFGARVRDVVPRERIRAAKRVIARTPPPGGHTFDVTVERMRRELPDLCADADADHRWVRQNFIEPVILDPGT